MQKCAASCSLLIMFLMGAAAGAAPVQVRVLKPTISPIKAEQLAARLIATRQGPEKREDAGKPEKRQNRLSFELGALEEQILDLEPGIWRLVLEAHGFWTEPILMTVEEEGNMATFELWLTGTIEGRVEVPKGGHKPKLIHASFETSPELIPLPRAQLNVQFRRINGHVSYLPHNSTFA